MTLIMRGITFTVITAAEKSTVTHRIIALVEEYVEDDYYVNGQTEIAHCCTQARLIQSCMLYKN